MRVEGQDNRGKKQEETKLLGMEEGFAESP